MNIRLKTTLLSLTFLVALLSVFFSAVASAKEPSTQIISSQNQEFGYILTEFNGKLSIFETGATSPVAVLDVLIDSLPERDIKRLKNGIYCATFSEAMQLAEDYE